MKTFHRLCAALGCIALFTATLCMAQSHSPRVLILVTSADKFADGHPTGLWLEEFAVPYETLVQGGAIVTVVSPKGGQVPVDPRSQPSAQQQKEWANAERVLRTTAPLSATLRASDFDAIFIPGGHGPLFDLATSPQVAQLISEFARTGKPVASVCHGPAALLGVTLADGTSFVKGKKVTAFSDSEEIATGLQNAVPFSVQQKLITLDASYSQGRNFSEYVVEDGELITGQNPASSARAAKLLLEKLKDNNSAAK